MEAFTLSGWTRERFRMGRLFFEADDAPVLVRLDDAELPGGDGRIHFDGGNGDVRAGIDVLLEHLLVIHFVDVVAGKDEDVIGLLAADGIDVLINGVGRALIPMLRNAHLRRENFDEFAETHEGGPAAPDVAVEAERFVLREDEDAAQIAIEAIGKGDVDDAVNAAERNGGLGAIARERPKPLALAARQQHTDRVAHDRHEYRRSRSDSGARHSSSNEACKHASSMKIFRRDVDGDMSRCVIERRFTKS